MSACDDNCEHPGYPSKPANCLDCGRFSRHSWDTGWFSTQDGAQQRWGGTCKTHGAWSESAA